MLFKQFVLLAIIMIQGMMISGSVGAPKGIMVLIVIGLFLFLLERQ